MEWVEAMEMDGDLVDRQRPWKSRWRVGGRETDPRWVDEWVREEWLSVSTWQTQRGRSRVDGMERGGW